MDNPHQAILNRQKVMDVVAPQKLGKVIAPQHLLACALDNLALINNYRVP
jgi:hypothetical protein